MRTVVLRWNFSSARSAGIQDENELCIASNHGVCLLLYLLPQLHQTELEELQANGVGANLSSLVFKKKRVCATKVKTKLE
jgi:hypothetical protein